MTIENKQTVKYMGTLLKWYCIETTPNTWRFQTAGKQIEVLLSNLPRPASAHKLMEIRTACQKKDYRAATSIIIDRFIQISGNQDAAYSVLIGDKRRNPINMDALTAVTADNVIGAYQEKIWRNQQDFSVVKFIAFMEKFLLTKYPHIALFSNHRKMLVNVPAISARKPAKKTNKAGRPKQYSDREKKRVAEAVSAAASFGERGKLKLAADNLGMEKEEVAHIWDAYRKQKSRYT